MIIFLNGNSSSGKSVIAREIMRQSERPFLYFSVDHLINFWIDEKFIAFEDEPKAWFFNQHLKNHSPEELDVTGPHPNQLHWDMITSLTVLIKKGYDLIIDEVLWNPEIFEKCTGVLIHSDMVYLIKITCDLIECERRERLRADRYQGLARSLVKPVYNGSLQYDFSIDTTYLPVKACAKSILEYVEHHSKPNAFIDYLLHHIHFDKLKIADFYKIHTWLNLPHLNNFCGENKAWRLADIEAKYQDYLKGYKLENTYKKPINAFIIYCAQEAIGYIQYYNIYDFQSNLSLEDLPRDLAGVDFYIGETAYLNKGLGTQAIRQFLSETVFKDFAYCLVEPDADNQQVIRVYEKAGFKRYKSVKNKICMIAKKE